MSKEGALGLQSSSADLVASFDCDFVLYKLFLQLLGGPLDILGDKYPIYPTLTGLLQPHFFWALQQVEAEEVIHIVSIEAGVHEQ